MYRLQTVLTIALLAKVLSGAEVDRNELARTARAVEGQPPLRLLGWHAYASRFIHPPLLRVEPIEGAASYRAELRATTYRADRRDVAGAVHIVDSREPSLDLSSVWDRLLTGTAVAWLAALDAEGRTLASTMFPFHKAFGFQAAPRPWKCTPEELVEGVARYLIDFRSPKAIEPDRPPLLWHSTISTSGELAELGYPTHNAYHIEFFIDFAKWTKDEALARRGLTLARELADFNLKHRTPADWKLPNVFYTTTVDGRMGGDKDGDTLIVTLTGLMGRSLLRLGFDQDEPRYVRAAADVARCLLATQFPTGNWPFRVEPKSGRVDNAYTSNVIMPVLLFDELIAAPEGALRVADALELREPLLAARKRALQWLIEGPMRDDRWEGFCEDIGDMAPYVALEWYDAAWTARYFIEHRAEFPDQFEPSLRVLDWIEDQFVAWTTLDLPHMESAGPPIVPVVFEQYRCYKPVDACNAWLLDVYLSAARASGREVYLQKARALAAALSHARRPSGAIATWMMWRGPRRGEDTADWFSCMVYDAHMIMRHEAKLR